MTLGFIVTFFDFRNDVRRVIRELDYEHEVILFCRQRDIDRVQNHIPDGVEIRVIKEEGSRLKDRLTRMRYRITRAIPKSTQNFYLMEAFKNGRLRGLPSQKAKAFYHLHRTLPNNYTYDAYLNDIEPLGGTDISRINAFVCFSEIADDALLARLLGEGHAVLTYVYSWDHPCKHTRFSTRSQNLVWNTGLADDLCELQGVPRKNITVLGASQFCYIYEYLNEYKQNVTTKIFDFPYIYMGCAIGIESLVPQEVDIAVELADLILQISPQFKLVVRPYPPLGNWSLYDRLYAHSAIEVDDDFRNSDMSVNQKAIIDKFVKLDQAEGFFHLGTTLGLECCFTSTPSFLLDVREDDGEIVNIFNFVHQYQNDKYLVKVSPENHAKGWEKTENILSNIENIQYLKLNKKVQDQNPLFTFAAFAKLLADELQGLSKVKI
ncbi:hypothetical protein [Neolewinella antarctica]|uniref:Glycosyltransferase family 1 protein n=1 Tax=Neolewinella antarctica TaxID=442734 RepID=A0ABX0XA26_9BACT|nr:hypothetical protein [Neolewinella antarctica]NJC26109.1 hypothetical protein [Neolewinella antarctica]